MKKLLLVSTVCLLLTGGGLKPAPTAVKAQTPFAVAQADNSSQTPSASQTQVELLDAGAEPRQELRFTPTVNTKQTARITTNMDVSNSISGQQTPSVKIPSSTMTMDVAVTQVDANGDIHAQFSYTKADVLADPSVPPQVLDTMRAAIKQVVGLKGFSVIDNRGQVKSSSFVLPERLDPITRQVFEQMSNSLSQISAAPLPLEAIGKGAKWRVTNSFDVGGINLSQTAIYELVDRQDNVITLNIAIEQQGNSQELTPPGAPPGASFTLKSMTSQGQGQAIMRLDAVMPTRTTLSINSKNEMNIKVPNSGEEVAVETNLSMQMALDSQIQQ